MDESKHILEIAHHEHTCHESSGDVPADIVRGQSKKAAKFIFPTQVDDFSNFSVSLLNL